MKKSQASTDYLMLLGLIMAIIIVISFYTLRPKEDIDIIRASSLMDTIADYVNHVAELGPGNQLRAQIDIPSGVDSITFSRGEINIRVYDKTERPTTLHRLIKANVTGYLSNQEKITPGTHEMMFMALAGGHVCISRPENYNEDCYCVNLDSGEIEKPRITQMNEYNNQYIACTVNGTTKDCSQHGLKYGDVISGFKAQCVGNQSNNKIPAVMVFEVINWQNQKVFPPTQYEGTVFHSDSNGFYHLENIHYTIQNSGPITVKTTCYHECHIMHEDNSNLRPKKNITFEVPYGTIMGFVFDMFGNKIYTEDGLPDFHYPLKDPEGDEPDHYGLGRIQSGDQAVIITGYECVGGECIMVNASLYHGGTQE